MAAHRSLDDRRGRSLARPQQPRMFPPGSLNDARGSELQTVGTTGLGPLPGRGKHRRGRPPSDKVPPGQMAPRAGLKHRRRVRLEPKSPALEASSQDCLNAHNRISLSQEGFACDMRSPSGLNGSRGVALSRGRGDAVRKNTKEKLNGTPVSSTSGCGEMHGDGRVAPVLSMNERRRVDGAAR